MRCRTMQICFIAYSVFILATMAFQSAWIGCAAAAAIAISVDLYAGDIP